MHKSAVAGVSCKTSRKMGDVRDYIMIEERFRHRTSRVGFRFDENTLAGLRARPKNIGCHSLNTMHNRNLTAVAMLAQQEWDAALEACFSVRRRKLGPKTPKVGIGVWDVTGKLRLGRYLFSAAVPAT